MTLEEVNEYWIKTGIVTELHPLKFDVVSGRPLPRIYLPILGEKLEIKFSSLSTKYVYLSGYNKKRV